MKLKLFALTMICAVAICGCAECKTKNTTPDPKNASGVKNEQGGVAWVYTLSEGLAISKSTKKPLMVDFFATWCGWCKKLDKDVYTNAEVLELSKEFVCVKVDTDKNSKDTEKYVIQGLPTVAFLNADGTIIDKLVGYTAAPAFSLKMKKVLKK
jgi:thiol:disulfide interchange protein